MGSRATIRCLKHCNFYFADGFSKCNKLACVAISVHFPIKLFVMHHIDLIDHAALFADYIVFRIEPFKYIYNFKIVLNYFGINLPWVG